MSRRRSALLLCVCQCWLGKRLPHVMTRHGASGAETQTMHASVLLRSPPAAACLKMFIQTYTLSLEYFSIFRWCPFFQRHTNLCHSEGNIPFLSLLSFWCSTDERWRWLKERSTMESVQFSLSTHCCYWQQYFSASTYTVLLNRLQNLPNPMLCSLNLKHKGACHIMLTACDS